MPQFYKRKTDRVAIPAALMTAAVKKVVNDNKSLRTVAKENKIPRTTLQRYILFILCCLAISQHKVVTNECNEAVIN